MKVRFLDKRILKIFLQITSAVSAALSVLLLFVEIPNGWKLIALGVFMAFLVVTYIAIWVWSNNLNHAEISVEGSDITIKVGDIFKQSGFKAVAFNEYFDTQVDNNIISERSLNGIFIKEHLGGDVSDLDNVIDTYKFELGEFCDENHRRVQGKKRRYRLGTIVVYKEYLLTALSKFDESCAYDARVS